MSEDGRFRALETTLNSIQKRYVRTPGNTSSRSSLNRMEGGERSGHSYARGNLP